MKIMILGKGGREHALAWRLSLEDHVSEILVLPGNPGMEMTPKVNCLPVQLEVSSGFVRVVQSLAPELVIVGPEDPLCEGIVDILEDKGLCVFGPSQKAALLEGSKIFAKEFMRDQGIPTAEFNSFENVDEALSFAQQIPWKSGAVVKADGLAAGKGVVVAQNREEVEQAIKDLMQTSDYGVQASKIIIEEKLKGPELSVFALCDGEDFLSLGVARDYKRLKEGDEGPNTGGMGCVTPSPGPSKEWLKKVEKQVFAPVLKGLKEKGTPFKGVLFAGLMLDDLEDFKVLEFNVRFGDPETQTLLPLVEGNFAEVLQACARGNLRDVKSLIRLSSKFSVHIVLASQGYPGVAGQSLSLGHTISFEDTLLTHNEIGPYGFMAGVKKGGEGKLINSGGRVMGVTFVAEDLELAREQVYEALKKVHFEGAQWRKDIGS